MLGNDKDKDALPLHNPRPWISTAQPKNPPRISSLPSTSPSPIPTAASPQNEPHAGLKYIDFRVSNHVANGHWNDAPQDLFQPTNTNNACRYIPNERHVVERDGWMHVDEFVQSSQRMQWVERAEALLKTCEACLSGQVCPCLSLVNINSSQRRNG